MRQRAAAACGRESVLCYKSEREGGGEPVGWAPQSAAEEQPEEADVCSEAQRGQKLALCSSSSMSSE